MIGLKPAKAGGKLAGDARKKVERDRRVRVVSPDNFLKQIKDAAIEKSDLLPPILPDTDNQKPSS